MSDLLKSLITEWNNQAVIVKIDGDRWAASVKLLTQINQMVFEQAKKEGVDISGKLN